MILSFRDQITMDIFDGINSKVARSLPKAIWKVASRRLDMINAAHDLKDLMIPPGNRLEALKGRLSGFYSIRINDQFRIIFKWSQGNATEVQILDYH